MEVKVKGMRFRKKQVIQQLIVLVIIYLPSYD